MANPVTLAQAASFLTSDTLKWSAWGLRDTSPRPAGEGVQHYQAWRVMQRQAGATMTVDVGATGVGLMEAWVRGDTRGGQGLYRVDNIDRTAPTASTFVSQINVTVSNNAAANPRLDIVVLEVVDLEHIGGGTATAQVRVIAGTATAGATLDNRNGAPSLPASALHLADILVPATESTSIDTADIRDRRAFNLPGVAGMFAGTPSDRVTFQPVPGLRLSTSSGYAHGSHDLAQVAALMYLPRQVSGATHLYWKYLQGGTATAGNYVIFIADSSMRVVASTSSIAFTGALNTYQVRDETITSLSLDAGLYFVGFGFDSSAGTALSYVGCEVDIMTGSQGVALRSATGGVTVPSTLAAFTDSSSLTSSTSIPSVPIVTLGV